MVIPVRSLRRLIQEDFYPDEFKVLACCLLLNRCRGAAVRKVVGPLFDRWPDAASMAQADAEALSNTLAPLGLQRQRATRLKAFSAAFEAGFKHAAELPGVGPYAEACWRIFFLEELGDEAPDDHALKDYWRIAKGGLWPEGGWGRDERVEARRAWAKEARGG